MPIPLIPALAVGLGSGAATTTLGVSAEQERLRRAEQRRKDRAIDKYYTSTMEDRYGPKGKEFSNRNMADETGEADTLSERASRKADAADIANREASLSAEPVLSADQRRGVAREAALESRYGPSQAQRDRMERSGMKKGGAVKKMAGGGSVKTSSASRRGDGIAQRGKTKGRMI
jgi:hypothetical protein